MQVGRTKDEGQICGRRASNFPWVKVNIFNTTQDSRGPLTHEQLGLPQLVCDYILLVKSHLYIGALLTG
jgi:hypothetical protein